MAWGSATYGSSDWGDGAEGSFVEPTLEEGKVKSIDIWSSRFVEIEFYTGIKNDVNIVNTINYSVTPNNKGDLVKVKRIIRDPKPSFITKVYLIITPFTQGSEYTVTVSNLRTREGGILSSSNNTGTFKGRSTKIDDIEAEYSSFYDRSVRSNIGTILASIIRQDDLIGGSKGE